MKLTSTLSRKFYLPVGACVLTALLLTADSLHPRLPGDHSYTLEKSLCYGINAPVIATTWMFLYHLLARLNAPLLILNVLNIALVPVFWYAVAVEVTGEKAKGSVITSLTQIRGIADLALIAGGVFLLLCAISAASHSHRSSDALYYVPCAFWAVTLVWFYARDLYLYRLKPGATYLP